MCSCVFSVHPGWRLLDISCLYYGLKSAFVVDSPTPCVLNIIGSVRPLSDVSYRLVKALVNNKVPDPGGRLYIVVVK